MEKHKASGPVPLESHKVTQPVFNVRPLMTGGGGGGWPVLSCMLRFLIEKQYDHLSPL